jgi:hypothetical protein
MSNITILNNKEKTYSNFSTGTKEVLDIVLCSPHINTKFTEFKVLHNFDMNSDHLPIKLIFQLKNKLIVHNANQHNELNLNKADWTKFKDNLPTSIPHFNENYINQLNNYITRSLIEAAEKAIPKKKSYNYKETLPDEILLMIKYRKTARKRAQKAKATERDKAIFNNINKLIKSEIVAYKNQKWSNFLESLGKNPVSTRPFWQKINKIRNKNQNKKSEKIPSLNFNNAIYTTNDEKANIFGSILEQTFKDSNDEKFNKEFEQMIKLKVDEFKMKNKNHVSIFEPFSLKELNTEIKKLKKQSAVGGDKIHNLYIINASDSFTKQILHLVNETIRQNEIPSEWKTTIVKMIPKKKAGSTNPKDYRPISITSCLGKLAERLINMRLTKFIEENNLIKFCEDYNYIEASDLFLREIELLVNKDIEFNKNRIRIEDRLKKFEDIEWDLYQRYRYKEGLIYMNELFISRHDLKGEHKEGLIEKIQKMKLEIKESINIQRLILELQERKSKVYKRIEELGIKFC